ncbi:hypothetical protein X801_05132 [Opisthorchis viverrini]|uniref:Uncharacterized protein n=1 Tax=Opisthorchis viverrini TaxID=6198 RepID=A0A1S8WX16_OPIVI|nr:hypothetical protein X801_05132 [Opisthorchis viverrini]
MPDSIKEVLRPKKRDRSGGNGINRSLLSGPSLSHNSLGYSVTTKPPRTTTPTLYCQLGSRDTPDGGEGFLAEDIMKLTLSLEQELDDVDVLANDNNRYYHRSCQQYAPHLVDAPSVQVMPEARSRLPDIRHA